MRKRRVGKGSSAKVNTNKGSNPSTDSKIIKDTTPTTNPTTKPTTNPSTSAKKLSYTTDELNNVLMKRAMGGILTTREQQIYLDYQLKK